MKKKKSLLLIASGAYRPSRGHIERWRRQTREREPKRERGHRPGVPHLMG